jgi:hypothetical protein
MALTRNLCGAGLGRRTMLAFAALAAAAPGHAAPRLLTIAVATFDYTDTSGEIADQSRQHQERLQHLANLLAHDLARTARYQAMVLPKVQPCPAGGCTADADPAALLAQARAAGADLLIYGGVHKMSTLVQFARMDVVATATGRLRFRRLITFRNDTDESWDRAGQFAADEVLAASPHT